MNEHAAIALLRKVSVFELSGADGCYCMACSIQGVDIDVSCRKSGGSRVFRKLKPDFSGLVVRAHSSHMDANLAALQAVADVVCEQLREHTSQAIETRLCDYRHDAEQLCCYCDKPREDAGGYFCDAHKNIDQERPA
jgi:hypothetical protein